MFKASNYKNHNSSSTVAESGTAPQKLLTDPSKEPVKEETAVIETATAEANTEKPKCR